MSARDKREALIYFLLFLVVMIFLFIVGADLSEPPLSNSD